MCIHWCGCNMKHCGQDTPLQFATLTQVPNFCPSFRRHVITFCVFLQFIHQCFPTREARTLTTMHCTAVQSSNRRRCGQTSRCVLLVLVQKKDEEEEESFCQLRVFFPASLTARGDGLGWEIPKSLIRAFNHLQEVRRDAREIHFATREWRAHSVRKIYASAVQMLTVPFPAGATREDAQLYPPPNVPKLSPDRKHCCCNQKHGCLVARGHKLNMRIQSAPSGALHLPPAS